LPDPLVLVRAVHIAATLLAAGTVTFLALAAGPALRAAADGAETAALCRRCDRIAGWALAVAVLSGAAWLALVSAAILDKPVMPVVLHGGALSVAGGTRFGLVCILRLALAIVLALLLLRGIARAWQAVIACAFAALIAFCGHAGATPGLAGDIHLIADVGHLIAASAWLGALPALALLLAEAGRRDDPAWRAIAVHTTVRFSRVGVACVAVLLASGVVATVNLLDSPRQLIDTDYGRLLALKIALFVAMVAIAAVNRFRLTPRLPQAGALAALTRNSLAETALGLGVIVAVAALGTMEPGRHTAHHAAATAIPDSAAFVHLHMPEVMADVTVDPGRPGQSGVILRVMREDGSEFPTDSVKFALDPPDAAPVSAPRLAQRQPDGTWRIDGIGLARPGIWTVRVIVATDAPAPAVLDGPIVIGP
jgi:putative copper resistance protein D